VKLRRPLVSARTWPLRRSSDGEGYNAASRAESRRL